LIEGGSEVGVDEGAGLGDGDGDVLDYVEGGVAGAVHGVVHAAGVHELGVELVSRSGDGGMKVGAGVYPV